MPARFEDRRGFLKKKECSKNVPNENINVPKKNVDGTQKNITGSNKNINEDKLLR